MLELETPLHLNVFDLDNAIIAVKIWDDTFLYKLMDAVCDILGKDPSTVRFLFHDITVLPMNTPASVSTSTSHHDLSLSKSTIYTSSGFHS